LGPGQRESLVQGKVVDHFITRGRSTSYVVTVACDNGKRVKLEITATEYSQLEIGQKYSQYWKIGSLGLLYR
jgi:hypothetical protein